jgi:hypothetical protein
LYVASGRDGKAVGQIRLDAPPVWDGMAAARGKLYVATTNGTIVCLAGE